MKTVSVVMCTFNGEKYLREQLDSIVNQTYPIYELIVQDDCSTDNTMSIVREYASRYPFIKMYTNQSNLGFNRNFQTACMRSSGDFVAISDQDDVWYPERIEKQVKTIGNHDICFCSHHRSADWEKRRLVEPQFSFETLVMYGSIAGHTMLLKGDFARNEEMWLNYVFYDWGLAINAQLRNGIVRTDEPLNWHRIHDEETGRLVHLKYMRRSDNPKRWEPYFYGYSNYRYLQKKENWKRLYSFIYTSTKDKKKFAIPCKMSYLMLQDDIFSLMKLCYICAKRRHTTYYLNNVHGIMGLIRGFFYPFIFAYNNTSYDL